MRIACWLPLPTSAHAACRTAQEDRGLRPGPSSLSGGVHQVPHVSQALVLGAAQRVGRDWKRRFPVLRPRRLPDAGLHGAGTPHGRATRPVEVVFSSGDRPTWLPAVAVPVRDRPQCGLPVSRELPDHIQQTREPCGERHCSAIWASNHRRSRYSTSSRPPRRKRPRPDVLSG